MVRVHFSSVSLDLFFKAPQPPVYLTTYSVVFPLFHGDIVHTLCRIRVAGMGVGGVRAAKSKCTTVTRVQKTLRILENQREHFMVCVVGKGQKRENRRVTRDRIYEPPPLSFVCFEHVENSSREYRRQPDDNSKRAVHKFYE